MVYWRYEMSTCWNFPGNQPRVRPFGTAHIFEDRLYIQTGKVKDVSKQIHANPKVVICAFKSGEWLRVAGKTC